MYSTSMMMYSISGADMCALSSYRKLYVIAAAAAVIISTTTFAFIVA
jgi:hypothetical protein